MDNIDISFGDDVLLGHGKGVTIDDYNDNVISSESVVGPAGPPGPAGYSPIANVTQTEDGAIIRITDEKGTTTANVYNGADGVSPTATVTGTASGATISITDANGTTTATVNNGEDGDPGDNATIAIGQVSTLAPGSQATVSNVGTATNAVLDFGIPEGLQGDQGIQGDPGINAVAYVTQNTGSATITIEDADGITTATVYDGQDGTNGTDGVSPVATVTPTASGATISITDAQGTTTANITNGQNGSPGADGYSPTASVSKVGDTATITITDQNGTTTASITDGTDGTNGTDGVTPVISATASVDNTTGTPAVTVTKSGTDASPSFAFAFEHLKGQQGEPGTIEDLTAVPKFNAYYNTTYSNFPASTPIPFNTQVVNVGSFTLSSGQVTIPKSGNYMITVQLWVLNNDSRSWWRLRRNGNTIGESIISGTSYWGLTAISNIYSCTQGDVIDVIKNGNESVNLNSGSADKRTTSISIQYIG